MSGDGDSAGARRAVEPHKVSLGTAALLHPSPRVIDVTLVAQAREERRAMAMLSTRLQSSDITSTVRRLAEQRSEKQRRLRKKFETSTLT